MTLKLTVAVEEFPIDRPFVISRGAKTLATVVTATLERRDHVGRGECVPYPRYGESVEGVIDAIESVRIALEGGADRHALQRLLPAGAARNAVDCAFWDLEAKEHGAPAFVRAELTSIAPVTTAYTLSVGTPEEMFEAAQRASDRPILKVKLKGEGDAARIAAVRKGAPRSRLIVDANESWSDRMLGENMAACARAGVALVEQPLPADADALLARMPRRIPLCADESAHDGSTLESLRPRYDAVNIKLDKTGGLTEALSMARNARKLGLIVMAGCMVGTSLAMAPAVLIAQLADFVDLDGPLLLARDRVPGLAYEGSRLFPPTRELWG